MSVTSFGIVAKGTTLDVVGLLLLMLSNSGAVQNFVGIHPTRKENNDKQGWSARQIAPSKLMLIPRN